MIQTALSRIFQVHYGTSDARSRVTPSILNSQYISEMVPVLVLNVARDVPLVAAGVCVVMPPEWVTETYDCTVLVRFA